MKKRPIELVVNEIPYEVVVSSNQTLLELLREELGLTGTKESCNMGACGSCTVLINGKAVLSCLILAAEAQGKKVTTIEGLRSPHGELHPLQEAFLNHGAIQCGFCTPGMILAGKSLLDENPNPSENDIKQALAGHLCRCTGYAKIIEAVHAAAGANTRD